MKKIIVPVLAVAAFATLAFAGENYFHSVKAEFGAFASRLGVGMSEPSGSYVLDVAGASRVTGVLTLVGSPAITGSPAVVGAVSVATSATSGYGLVFKGAVVTLSTQPAVEGEIWFQTSDRKVYVSTRVPAANVTYCNATGCYSALN